jgi:hypothetical protein
MAQVIYVGDNERVIEPEGSAKIFLKRRDPYGFWYVVFERGVVPDSLSSAFTTVLAANQAVDRYLETSSVRKRLANSKTE